ncbi:GNAT family N-acetyltransferase [Phenylobacterium kunshanense]|uniref:N-acetyltransferase n=1 Tax=Phenylobacterium kunshanense TaxID=1445034 RepID=A0A328BQH1_9CAUL|nr:GNAT family N-acetyltransferase [Phenylobacterium kunshanense]RAK68849.1 N-acetyltransferase [Phenylobacterium kunshanense]
MPGFLMADCAAADAWVPHLRAGTLWIAEADGQPVGFLAARVEDARLHIDELDVDRSYQGRGVGRRLLATAIDWARDHGVGRASLTTFRSIPWNGPFYASLGFREWSDDEIPPTIRQALAEESARGLPDRCAMVMVL